MSEPDKEVNVKGSGYLNRLSKEEFLTQLDTAAGWMIWVNPNIEEVELVVKDVDGKMSIFHGPDPMSMPFPEYKAFAAEIDKMTEAKDTSDGGG